MNKVLCAPPKENGYLPNNARFQKLEENVIFVMGSNRKGIHGAGSAKDAMTYFGAIWGIGEGLQGTTYALPTCSIPGEGLSLHDIQKHVETFKKVVANNPRLSFMVTAVGCGYAGYTDKDIAPMFKGLERCWFPESWRQYLEA